MNQILSVANEPQKETKVQAVQPVKQQPAPQIESVKRANQTSNKADIAKVIRIFCILIIVFGIVLIAQSAYAMISKTEKKLDKVEVFKEQMGKETKIIVESDNPIKQFSYRWNDGVPTDLDGNGTVKFETVIQIPNNILRMTITDSNGSKQNFFERYIYESSDIVKPVIDISAIGTKLNITATDDVEMSYITVSWNDEEATRIEAEEDESKTINVEVEVPEGQNKLTIVASDKEGNRETRTENIVGDTKPELTVTKDGQGNLVIKATDDEGIVKLTATVDGQTYDAGDINLKEINSKLPVGSGTHNISVTATNVNGLSTTQSFENVEI